MSTPVAIVAGGGGGLGRAVVANLAGSGYEVVAVDRDAEKLGNLPDGVHREVGDFTVATAVAPLIERVVVERGVPDVLVNTLGAFLPGPAMATTQDQLQTMLDVNLGAALWLSQAVAPHMSGRGGGAILHVSARPGLDPTNGMAAYSTSKAGLIYLTRVLDLELRPSGIRVNSVVPELIATESNRRGAPEGDARPRCRAGGHRRHHRLPCQ